MKTIGKKIFLRNFSEVLFNRDKTEKRLILEDYFRECIVYMLELVSCRNVSFRKRIDPGIQKIFEVYILTRRREVADEEGGAYGAGKHK